MFIQCVCVYCATQHIYATAAGTCIFLTEQQKTQSLQDYYGGGNACQHWKKSCSVCIQSENNL